MWSAKKEKERKQEKQIRDRGWRRDRVKVWETNKRTHRDRDSEIKHELKKIEDREIKYDKLPTEVKGGL